MGYKYGIEFHILLFLQTPKLSPTKVGWTREIENLKQKDGGDIGGSWTHIFLFPQQMYNYRWSNSLWKKSKDKPRNSYTLGEQDNT